MKRKNLTQFQQINDVLSSKAFDWLLSRVSKYRAYNQTFKACLPSELQDFCEVASINHKKQLVLLTSSSIWKHQLRFHVGEIESKLKLISSFPYFQGIQIQVCPQFLYKPSYEIRTIKDLPRPKQPNKFQQEKILALAHQHQGTKLGTSLKHLYQTWLNHEHKLPYISKK